MKIDLYVSINSTSQDTFICEIDEERLEEIMLEYIERMHPELMPLDDDQLIIVPEFQGEKKWQQKKKVFLKH